MPPTPAPPQRRRAAGRKRAFGEESSRVQVPGRSGHYGRRSGRRRANQVGGDQTFRLSDPLYGALLGMQVVFYTVALLAMAWPSIGNRFALARISAFFLMVNVAALLALVQWLAGVRQELWQPTQRTG